MTGGADFWSRRKARVEAEAEAEALAARAAEEAAREAAQAGKTDEEICADLGLPDPDTLGPGDDFRAFMARAVPERLRRRALQRTAQTVAATHRHIHQVVSRQGSGYTDLSTILLHTPDEVDTLLDVAAPA